MNKNSIAIIVLCSSLCLDENVKPFESSEWSKLAEKLISLKLSPHDLINYSPQDLAEFFTEEEVFRIVNLSSRIENIYSEIDRYEKIGIKIVTRADKDYPKMLKIKLKGACPPLFYYVGDISICNRESFGFVGSRKIEIADENFTRFAVKKSLENNYAIVSGGAKGVDSISVETALSNGGCAIEYISDSLIKKVRNKNIMRFVAENRLVVLSVIKPEDGFDAKVALSRNKYIYSQSKATVVVKSDYNKGGTWAGSTEALKKGYCKVLCWNNRTCRGNIEVIKKGALEIDQNWNGEIPLKEEYEQLPLF